MLKKGSKLNSILTGSCPKCQEESMYVDKNPYPFYISSKTHFPLSPIDLMDAKNNSYKNYSI